jgi:hypothetical protein
MTASRKWGNCAARSFPNLEAVREEISEETSWINIADEQTMAAVFASRRRQSHLGNVLFHEKSTEMPADDRYALVNALLKADMQDDLDKAYTRPKACDSQFEGIKEKWRAEQARSMDLDDDDPDAAASTKGTRPSLAEPGCENNKASIIGILDLEPVTPVTPPFLIDLWQQPLNSSRPRNSAFLKRHTWHGRATRSEDRKYPQVKILSDFGLSTGGPESPASIALSNKLREDAMDRSWLKDPAEVSLGNLICADEAGTVYNGSWRGSAVEVRVLKHKAGVDITHNECRDMLRCLASPMMHPGLVMTMGVCQPKSDDGSIMLLGEPDLVAGQFANVIQSVGASPLKVARKAVDLLQALSFLHQAKPPIVLGRLDANRLAVDDDGRLKIRDVDIEVAMLRINRDFPMGTCEQDAWIYRAPEGSNGMSPSNIYSAGVICLALLLRRTPTHADIEKLLSSPAASASASCLSPLRRSKGTPFSSMASPSSTSSSSTSSTSSSSSRSLSSTSMSPFASSKRQQVDAIKDIVTEMLSADPAARPTALHCLQRFDIVKKALQECKERKRSAASCSVM